MLKTQEKKCKVLEIIPYDLDKNHCEIITSMCLQMFFSVAMKNVATGGVSKSFAPQKTCKPLTSMLMMRKALEEAKGQTICGL